MRLCTCRVTFGTLFAFLCKIGAGYVTILNVAIWSASTVATGTDKQWYSPSLFVELTEAYAPAPD